MIFSSHHHFLNFSIKHGNYIRDASHIFQLYYVTSERRIIFDISLH